MTECGDGCTAPNIPETTELHAAAGGIEWCMLPVKLLFLEMSAAA